MAVNDDCRKSSIPDDVLVRFSKINFLILSLLNKFVQSCVNFIAIVPC